MPALFPAAVPILAQLRHEAQTNNYHAIAILGMLDNTPFCALSAGAENTNVIRITGQIRNAEGQPVAAVRDVFVKSLPVSGAGTMAAVSSQGTLKAGAASKEVWIQTKSDGTFQLDVTNAAVEDNLIVATLDNGTVEMLKLTYA
jgi:hypothetical protein